MRQVVHHVPDSHMNAYTRFKLALTEDVPTIKPYDEAKWAELEDGKSKLVEHSLALLDALHARWVFLLERLKPSDFDAEGQSPRVGRAACRSTTCSRCTRGTGGTTWRTSRRCESGVGGDGVWGLGFGVGVWSLVFGAYGKGHSPISILQTDYCTHCPRGSGFGLSTTRR